MTNSGWAENGVDYALCGCGHTCSTHDDAPYSLVCCGDCGKVVCDDCRVMDRADRCNDCAAVFYMEEWRDALREAGERVLNRMDEYNESAEEAAEAVSPDYGCSIFNEMLLEHVVENKSVFQLVR